jgi:hypothetical protein
MGKPAAFVSAFVDAVDEAMREHSLHHDMSAMQRAGRAWLWRPWAMCSTVYRRASRPSLTSLAQTSFPTASQGMGREQPCIGRSQGD